MNNVNVIFQISLYFSSCFSDEESEVGSTSEGNLSRNEQVRMIHMRRYIDQIREKVNEKQYLVDKTR